MREVWIVNVTTCLHSAFIYWFISLLINKYVLNNDNNYNNIADLIIANKIS